MVNVILMNVLGCLTSSRCITNLRTQSLLGLELIFLRNRLKSFLQDFPDPSKGGVSIFRSTKGACVVTI